MIVNPRESQGAKQACSRVALSCSLLVCLLFSQGAKASTSSPKLLGAIITAPQLQLPPSALQAPSHDPFLTFPLADRPINRQIQGIYAYSQSVFQQCPSIQTQVRQQFQLSLLQTPTTAYKRDNPSATYIDIPIRDHPIVEKYITYFTGRGRGVFQRWLDRSARYIPIIRPILEKAGLPRDTVYLAMIESGFNPNAYSSANAAGLWQFMRATGRMYGLHRNFWIDDRRDFIRATHGAAKHLRLLYRHYKNWPLSWAAYNAGQGRIDRALARYKVSDYWSLIEKDQAIAKETQHYVPKLMAATLLAKNPELYGFSNQTHQAPLEYEEVRVHDSVALPAMCEALSLDLKESRLLNPALRRDITPPRTTFNLRVPKGKKERLIAWLNATPQMARTPYVQYTIRPGDTLSNLAQRFDTNVHTLKAINHITNVHRLKRGQKLAIPTPNAHSQTQKPQKSKKNNRLPNKVARAISTTKSKPLMTPQNTKPQRITTELPRKRRAESPTSRTQQTSRRFVHTVKSGETLWSISRHYDIPMRDLMLWNQIESTHIRAGARLTVYLGKTPS